LARGLVRFLVAEEGLRLAQEVRPAQVELVEELQRELARTCALLHLALFLGLFLTPSSAARRAESTSSAARATARPLSCPPALSRRARSRAWARFAHVSTPNRIGVSVASATSVRPRAQASEM